MHYRLSLAALTVLELDPPTMVTCAAEAGFDHVGLRLIPSTASEPHWPTIGQTPLIKETKRRLEEHGIAPWDIETLRLKPDTDVKRDFEPFLATGAFLGARHIVVAGNDPDPRRLADNLAALADIAGEYGLTPNLEFMPWTDVRDLASAAKVCAAAGHDNLGILVDSIHLDRSLSDPAQIAELPATWFHYVQLCDATAERPSDTETLLHQARIDRRLPGEGDLDVLAPLRHLPRDLVISVEAPLELPQPARAEERASRAHEATLRTLALLG